MIGAEPLSRLESGDLGLHGENRDARVVILVVEPESLVREMLAASLELHDRRYRAVAAATVEEAVLAAHTERPALLLLDPAIPGALLPRDLVGELRAAFPGIPILGLTSTPQALFRVLPPLEALVEKPPDIDYLLRRVDDLLAAHTGGVLRDISLANLLQVLSADRKSCLVAVEAALDRGKIWLLRGRPSHAEAGQLRGREAFFHLLSFDSPLLRVRPDSPPAHSLDDTLPALLLEHSVLIDRRNRPA